MDRATRTAFVTVWQVDAWPRWRWEVNCLQGATGTAPETAPSGSTTILGTVRATYDPFNPPSLPVEVYLAILSHCAPAWDPTDRNTFTTDGLSLNDVDRATRTAFVTVWQSDAWPRWRWEVNCLQGAFTPGATLPAGAVILPAGAVTLPAGGVTLPAGAVTLPAGGVTLPAGAVTLPAGGVTLPADAVGSPGSMVRLGADQDPAEDPTTHPAFSQVYQAAVARGANDALARQIAIQVVTEERIEDFLNGTHRDVLYGEHECTVRSAACPLVPTLEEYVGSTSSALRSSPQMVSDRAGGTSRSSTGRFAGYHFPHCSGGVCEIDPEWPVLEYRNGEYFRCKGLEQVSRDVFVGVDCVPY